MVRARGGEKGRLMGRSQVVRQRILIPPFGGSSPPAPASQSGLHRYLREGLRNPRELGPFLVLGSVSVCRIWQRKRYFGALSPRAIFGISFLPATSDSAADGSVRLTARRLKEPPAKFPFTRNMGCGGST